MRLKGEDTADSFRDWVKANVKESGNRSYDLGKFLFGVSSGSIGILASLQKLDSAFLPTMSSMLPYGLFFLSLLMALNMVIPRPAKVGGDIDVYELYNRELRFVTSRTWAWFAVWMVAVVCCLLSFDKRWSF